MKQKLGTIVFWLYLGLAVIAVVIFFALPPESRAFRRAALIAAYVCGLPAALGLVVLAFERLGSLESPRDKPNNNA